MYNTRMTGSMVKPCESEANRMKVRQIEMALSELLAESLRRGFFGKAALELVIQDGTIQQFRRMTERVER